MQQDKIVTKSPASSQSFPGLNLWRQIQRSHKYQIDRLIHEDAERVDSSNLYETQARAVRRNYLFFDAWILLLSLVQGKFSRAAVSVLILLNGFTLRYLPGRPGVMDEVQGSSDKKKEKHLHPHDKGLHKGDVGFFEWGPSFPHMVLINC